MKKEKLKNLENLKERSMGFFSNTAYLLNVKIGA